MADVVVRAEARADMVAIYANGVAQFGEDAARSYMRGIDQALSRLVGHPLIGPAYPGLRSSIRYLACRRHHIFYDFDGTTVWVLSLIHI